MRERIAMLTALAVDASQGGNDTIIGGNGIDMISLGNGNNTVHLGGGKDYLSNLIGASFPTNLDGNNLITGGNGSGIISLGEGNNRIYAGTEVSLAHALVNQKTAAAENRQGYFIAVGDGDNVTLFLRERRVAANDAEGRMVA